ncbi:hypothetical protein [Streptomyces sp. NPDC014733]|uniref:hypothetical protein n=1 Tax=Streptomyces sp. NPDC014733 TaxID=3364885 RepID=UPI0037011985
MAVRDALLSRILRGPELVNRNAEPHGFANCYTHHTGDLVIEWCFGVTVETLCATLLAHGFADNIPRADAIELLSRHSAHFGERTVILKCHATCLYGHGVERVRSAESWPPRCTQRGGLIRGMGSHPDPSLPSPPLQSARGRQTVPTRIGE